MNLLKTKQAAEYLGVHRETLKLYVKRGKIKAVRLPGGHLRFKREELDRFCSDRGTLQSESFVSHQSQDSGRVS